MSSFTLKKQSAKVEHINLREEKHGEEPVLGVDVTIVADLPNDFLAQLAPTLKASLYATDVEALGQLSLVEASEHMPVLRYPAMGPISWECAFGAEFVLHGAKKAEDVVFGDAKVKKVSLAPKEGGTVELTFKAQANPGADGAGLLAAFLGRTVKVSVMPRDPVPGGDVSPLGE